MDRDKDKQQKCRRVPSCRASCLWKWEERNKRTFVTHRLVFGQLWKAKQQLANNGFSQNRISWVGNRLVLTECDEDNPFPQGVLVTTEYNPFKGGQSSRLTGSNGQIHSVRKQNNVFWGNFGQNKRRWITFKLVIWNLLVWTQRISKW